MKSQRAYLLIDFNNDLFIVDHSSLKAARNYAAHTIVNVLNLAIVEYYLSTIWQIGQCSTNFSGQVQLVVGI